MTTRFEVAQRNDAARAFAAKRAAKRGLPRRNPGYGWDQWCGDAFDWDAGTVTVSLGGSPMVVERDCSGQFVAGWRF
jgi:hypothetical protein